MARQTLGPVPVIDLFAGPGGLGEGFSALRVSGNRRPFKLHLSIEKDPVAHQTLRLRSLYRQFVAGSVPAQYYDVLRGKLSVQSLFEAHPSEAQAARWESWRAPLGLIPRGVLNGRIRSALDASDPWVLIGGPPCQAYSIAGRARNNGNRHYQAAADHRQYLYVEYLQVIADHWPAVFVMENVTGLLSANVNNRQLFQRILDDLRSPQEALRREERSVESRRRHSYRVLPLTPRSDSDGLDVGDYVVSAEKHGVPQARQRVFLVGVRDDLGKVSLPELPELDEVPVRSVLDGLPRLRSGLTKRDSVERWLGILATVPERRWLTSADHNGGRRTVDVIYRALVHLTVPKRNRGRPFIEGEFTPEYRPDWYVDPRFDGVSHHETRCHLDSDLHRYLFVSGFGKAHGRSPVLKEFPKDLLPAHENVESALKSWGIRRRASTYECRRRNSMRSVTTPPHRRSAYPPGYARRSCDEWGWRTTRTSDRVTEVGARPVESRAALLRAVSRWKLPTDARADCRTFPPVGLSHRRLSMPRTKKAAKRAGQKAAATKARKRQRGAREAERVIKAALRYWARRRGD